MAMGRRPFGGQTPFELAGAIAHAAPFPISEDVPAPLQTIIGRCLEKEPSRRYQNAGEVGAALAMIDSTPSARHEPPSPSRKRMWYGIAGALVVTAVVAAVLVGRDGYQQEEAHKTDASMVKVAVLPFDNLTGDAAEDYFSDGLTEEMLIQLSRLSPQRVGTIARTSVMRYKKTTKPLDQIARELGVDYVVTGSARRAARRVRVTATLVQARDQAQLWAKSYDEDISDLLTLEDDVTRRIAGALALTLLPAAATRSAADRRTSPEAYDAYLRGEAQLTLGGHETALHYFEQALQANPQSALTYAGVARVWFTRLGVGLADAKEGSAMAKAAAMKAIELDSTRAEAHSVLGGVKRLEFDWTGAEAAYRRALEIDPSYVPARVGYSWLLTILRRPAEARSQLEQALTLDPFNAGTKHADAQQTLYEGRLEEAKTKFRSVLELSPDFYPAHFWLWHLLHLQGKDADAFVEAKATFAAAGDNEVGLGLTRGYSEAGYTGAMRQTAAALEAAGAKRYLDYFSLANVYVHLGEKDRALDWLERGFDAGEVNIRTYLGMPTFDTVRDDPRFARLVKRMNLPH